MELSQRVSDRIARDFEASEREEAIYVLTSMNLPLPESAGDERVCAAALKVAAGNLTRLLGAAALAEVDWRDLLVEAGFADEDWRSRVHEFLGGGPSREA